MALDSAKKSEIIALFGKSEKDTGSPAVQIALQTARINNLTEHLKNNPKDHSSRLGLLKLVGQRRRLMRYLKKNDIAQYSEVIKNLGLRDRV
ncbi:MAG: 30S ribosomal protein S15 [Campylobacterales bacterium]